MHQLHKLYARNKGRGDFKVENAADAEATVYLYDMIVDTPEDSEFWGGVNPQDFIAALKAVKAPVINLRINSPGGSVFAARAMEQAIKDHSSKVIAHIDGHAASAATYVMLAADEVVISDGAMVMIHKAWSMAAGNADDLRSTADLLDKVDSTLVNTYAEKTGLPQEKLLAMMAAETWMTADEAVANGFATRKASTKSSAKANWDLSVYAHAPAPAAEEQPKFDGSHLLRRLEVATRI